MQLRIEVLPSPETNDHEVVLLGDGENLIQLFDHSLMGLDPDDLLREPSPLRALSTPHLAMIGRCTCGIIGCGWTKVEIRREEAFVIWQNSDASQKVQFAAAQYDNEVERAIHDFGWETPRRTAARLIREGIDRTILEHRGFKLDWVGAGSNDGMMTVSLMLTPGPYQVLVRLPWNGTDIEQIVMQFKLLLKQPPESWSDVQWYPQKLGLGPPAVFGS